MGRLGSWAAHAGERSDPWPTDVALDGPPNSDHNSGAMYLIEIGDAAQVDLAALRVFDRARILAVIKAELSHAPTDAVRRRRMLRDLRPAWEHVPPIWQVRVGDYRVFYDADETGMVVYVRRVIRKGTKTTGEIV